jgi:hypothetical protein
LGAVVIPGLRQEEHPGMMDLSENPQNQSEIFSSSFSLTLYLPIYSSACLPTFSM